MDIEESKKSKISIEAADIDEDLFDEPDENDFVFVEPTNIRKSNRFIDSEDEEKESDKAESCEDEDVIKQDIREKDRN